MYLKSKPTSNPTINITRGENHLNFDDKRDGVLYIPNSYTSDKAMPLLVLLHGSGGSVASWKKTYNDAENYKMIVLLVESRERTWDIIMSYSREKGFGEFNQDAIFLDKALQYTFSRCLVDKTKIALGGFSDGASYALSLGLLNGGLFTHLIAYSAGFIKKSDNFVGKPKVYITHGKKDKMLPISLSQKNIVPYLKEEGYDVIYIEHEEGHLINGEIIHGSLDWFV